MYKVEVSTDGEEWTAVSTGSWENTAGWKLAVFDQPMMAKYVRLTGLSTFGDSGNIKVGQRVLAIGNPYGFAGTLTQGIISRIDYSKNKIQTDAAINPGCSGGPLLNSAGEVIGINQSIYNPDNNISNIGIGFAIPINDAKKFMRLSTKAMKQ